MGFFSRRTILFLGLMVAVAVTMIIIEPWFRSRSTGVEEKILKASLLPQATDRLIVFAPHSDDEILGAAGMIKRAVEAGAQVLVVLMTNGDGFTYAAQDEFKTLRVTPRRYIEFAYIRQRESLEALKLLGVKKENVIFLGYPDRGLAAMWGTNWNYDNLYTSRFTRLQHSPYVDSYQKNAPYAGLSVVRDLREIMQSFQPTMVVMPHPNDAHMDHWATYNFVVYSLEELKEEGEPFTFSVRSFLYLVHRGDWPLPKGLNLDGELLPPTKLADLSTRWLRVDLAREDVALKYQAILKYRSQIALMRRFLVSFARKNELYGLLPPVTVAEVPDGRIRVDGDSRDWEGIGAAILDPTMDTIVRNLEGGADLKALDVAQDTGYLYIRVDVRRRVSSSVTYIIHLKAFGGQVLTGTPGRAFDLLLRPPGQVTLRESGKQKPRQRRGLPLIFPRLNVRAAGPAPANGVLFAARDRTLEVGVPLKLLGYPRSIFCGAETIMAGVRVDKTAWRLLSAAGPDEEASAVLQRTIVER
ncbi:MAG: PIG-L family deacetylase [Firmicutes bacterium]|nr:PIG-L family deacetylase [Bacillota bacterium]